MENNYTFTLTTNADGTYLPHLVSTTYTTAIRPSSASVRFYPPLPDLSNIDDVERFLDAPDFVVTEATLTYT